MLSFAILVETIERIGNKDLTRDRSREKTGTKAYNKAFEAEQEVASNAKYRTVFWARRLRCTGAIDVYAPFIRSLNMNIQYEYLLRLHGEQVRH